MPAQGIVKKLLFGGKYRSKIEIAARLSGAEQAV